MRGECGGLDGNLNQFWFRGALIMGRVKQVEQDRRESVLWTVLAKIGGKRARRDLLEDGSSTVITADITGTIGRAKIAESIAGTLHVGHETSKAASAAPNTDHVVGLLLNELDDEQRAKLVSRVTQHFERTGELPTVSDTVVKQAKAWLARLRAKSTTKVAGAVTFQVAGD